MWDPRCARPSDLVRPVALDPRGVSGPTRGQARSSRWRRTSRGWYIPADVDSSVVEQRILEQSVRLPSCGAVTGWASLRWQGATFFDDRPSAPDVDPLPVPVVLGGWADIGRDRQIVVSRERFWGHEIVVVAGVPCAVANRAVFDEMRRVRGLRRAVSVVEMAVAACLTTLTSFGAYVVDRSGWTGVPEVRQALILASADSRSPAETSMRLIWVLDADLPTPVCNQPLFNLRGELLGYPDLFDPTAGVVGEYDGADHAAEDRRGPDIAREQRFRDHGLEYFTLVRGDLRDRRRAAGRMLAARARARFAVPDQRQWTLDPPPWWADRRAG